MRKGFLNGPVAKKEEETVNEEVKKETGAVPKVKAEAAKPSKEKDKKHGHLPITIAGQRILCRVSQRRGRSR